MPTRGDPHPCDGGEHDECRGFVARNASHAIELASRKRCCLWCPPDVRWKHAIYDPWHDKTRRNSWRSGRGEPAAPGHLHVREFGHERRTEKVAGLTRQEHRTCDGGALIH